MCTSLRLAHMPPPSVALPLNFSLNPEHPTAGGSRPEEGGGRHAHGGRGRQPAVGGARRAGRRPGDERPPLGGLLFLLRLVAEQY